MDKEFDLIVVGELNADLILRGDVTPEFGQVEKLIDDATLTIGSSSGIFACGAARLGLRVAFIGKTGPDEFGQFMRRELTARGIQTSGIVVDLHLRTGLSVILSRVGDRAILTYPGAIPALRYDEIDLGYLSRARHLHIGSYFMLDELRPDIPRLLDEARRLGLTVSLDTNYDPSERWDGGLEAALARTDVFLPNEHELLAIARAADRQAALERLGSRIPMVAVKLGAEGGIARRGGETAIAPALPVTVVDTTGAGDSFDAGLIHAFLAGWDLQRALSFACACGSLSTRASGGVGAQPTLPEVLASLSW